VFFLLLSQFCGCWLLRNASTPFSYGPPHLALFSLAAGIFSATAQYIYRAKKNLTNRYNNPCIKGKMSLKLILNI
jgi:hypothetical protein